MTPEEATRELRAAAERLRDSVGSLETAEVTDALQRYEDAAEHIAGSWSGSNIGYHANIYYSGFARPAPGAFWSVEWGDMTGVLQSSQGDWREFHRDAVLRAIQKKAGEPGLSAAEAAAREMDTLLDDARSTSLSVITATLDDHEDGYLRAVKDEIDKVTVLSLRNVINTFLPSGSVISHDMRAMTGGIRSAVHQEVIGRVVVVRASFAMSSRLATLLERAASHIERTQSRSPLTRARLGDRVAIGHGNSPLWRELKDFVQDRLLLPWDEFNRVPVAGKTNVERLLQMLDGAGFALVVLTAEDERVDGSVAARQNAVHEAGLFQGRLGFGRAIVLLEEGCEEFSNIEGLGQIRFPPGNISACFEEVRRVLEREGLIEP